MAGVDPETRRVLAIHDPIPRLFDPGEGPCLAPIDEIEIDEVVRGLAVAPASKYATM